MKTNKFSSFWPSPVEWSKHIAETKSQVFVIACAHIVVLSGGLWAIYSLVTKSIATDHEVWQLTGIVEDHSTIGRLFFIMGIPMFGLCAVFPIYYLCALHGFLTMLKQETGD